MRSVVFGSLMLGVMVLILANRDVQRPALRGMTYANPWLWRMAAAMGGLLAVVLGVARAAPADGPGPARPGRYCGRRRSAGAVRTLAGAGAAGRAMA